MTGRNDWMGVGLKLLGVYFGVMGTASLWAAVLMLIANSGQQGVRIEGVGAVSILQPAVFLLAAYYLVCRTETTLRWCGEQQPEESV